MIHYQIPQRIEEIYQRNLLDWCRGGPRTEGWTRTGPVIHLPPTHISGHTRGSITTLDALAKNSAEVNRWHVNFLKHPNDIKHTNYHIEYLLPRYHERAEDYARSFINLYNSVIKNGVLKPIWVADVSALNIGFRYFRFDGCHRACAAHVAGQKEIPCIIFNTKVCELAS